MDAVHHGCFPMAVSGQSTSRRLLTQLNCFRGRRRPISVLITCGLFPGAERSDYVPPGTDPRTALPPVAASSRLKVDPSAPLWPDSSTSEDPCACVHDSR